MTRARDLTGQRFGRLVVLHQAPSRRYGHTTIIQWVCRCDCGAEHVAGTSDLVGGKTRSCGCLKREASAQRLKRHGQHGTVEYHVWLQMVQRCTNPNDEHWANYGGRGITVCDRWRESFEAFRVDMGARPGDEYSLERVDNSKGYEPGNVVWATRQEQANNTQRNVYLTHEGRTQTLAQWAREIDVPPYTLWSRLFKLHWSTERALTTPRRGRAYKLFKD